MKFHIAKQGETLAGIYHKYYGDIDLSAKWDENLAYFITFNIATSIQRPYKLNGGEMILLPESLPLDLSANPITLKDLGV